MHQTTPLKPICAAFLAVASMATQAQSAPWLTLYEGPGQVYTALVDPFSDASHPQPSLFFGGIQYLGCSVRWVGPLGITGTAPTPMNIDADPYNPNELGFDRWSGILYSVGAGTSGWQVRQSAAEGAPNSWSFVDVPYAAGSVASGFASDGAGNVFVCGNANGIGVVRRRDASGQWQQLRDWSQKTQAFLPRKMHITGGYLFVVGASGDKWAVQRLNLANNAWDMTYTGSPKGKKAGGWAVTSYGNSVYVLAWADMIPDAPKQCVLIGSANFGTGPWTILKTFAESPDINRPADLRFDQNGNLFVVGDSTFQTSEGNWHPTWIVRRCDAANGAWQWWLPFGYPADQVSYARQVSVDPSGAVFITGERRYRVAPNDYSDRRVVIQKWVP